MKLIQMIALMAFAVTTYSASASHGESSDCRKNRGERTITDNAHNKDRQRVAFLSGASDSPTAKSTSKAAGAKR